MLVEDARTIYEREKKHDEQIKKEIEVKLEKYDQKWERKLNNEELIRYNEDVVDAIKMLDENDDIY